MGFDPAKDTEEPKLSEDTENGEDVLFGMEDFLVSTTGPRIRACIIPLIILLLPELG